MSCYSLSGTEDKNQVCENHRQPLEENRGRAGVVQIVHLQHVGVKVPSRVGQAQLEPGEQRGVVQGPQRRVLQNTRGSHEKQRGVAAGGGGGGCLMKEPTS